MISNLLLLRSAPPHTGSPGPFGPGTPKESEKSPERVPRGRAPKVPKECALESQKSPKRVRKSGLASIRTLLRLWGALFGHFWGPAPAYSFRTLFGLFWGLPGPKGSGDPVWGRADCNPTRNEVFLAVPNSVQTSKRQGLKQNNYLSSTFLGVSYTLGAHTARFFVTLHPYPRINWLLTYITVTLQ